MSVQRLLRVRLEKLRDEHRRDIPQAPLALGAREMVAVAAGAQLVCDLVDDERRVRLGREHRVGVVEDLALFRLVQNAERDAGHDIVAMREALFREHLGELHAVVVVDADARVVCELFAEVVAEFGINLEEHQVRIRAHPLRDFAGVAALAGAEFRDNARAAVIHLVGHLANERFGTRHDRSDA